MLVSQYRTANQTVALLRLLLSVALPLALPRLPSQRGPPLLYYSSAAAALAPPGMANVLVLLATQSESARSAAMANHQARHASWSGQARLVTPSDRVQHAVMSGPARPECRNSLPWRDSAAAPAPVLAPQGILRSRRGPAHLPGVRSQRCSTHRGDYAS